MTITLTILNAATLPSGAPAFFRASSRGFLIGREEQLDWTLPDCSRQISSRHCEVRYENGAYLLFDQSTNGVFINGAAERMKNPHRLSDGDELRIGQYVIRTTVGSPTVADVSVPRPAQPDLLAAFAAGAGIAPEVFAGRDPTVVAREIGAFVRQTVENLSELLKARAAAKAMVKSASKTVLGTADNNPLKFAGSATEAIEIMFAPKRSGYLDARQSLSEAFANLRNHDIATYHAMQQALAGLLEDFEPNDIEMKAGNWHLFLRKARAWDLFVQRWEESSDGENGMLDEFFAHFAEAYDEKIKNAAE